MVVIEALPSITVRTAGILYSQVAAACQAAGPIELDLHALTEVDLSFVQLMHALREAAGDLGRPVRLRAPAPAPVVALLERAGFLAAPTDDDLDFWFHGERPQ